jgi:2-methylcitrate dehydratase
MVAVPLIFGRLTAKDYEDEIANDPVWGKRIDDLRARIVCIEDSRFTADYHDPEKRSIANAITLELNDGTVLPEVAVEFPIGHRLRRSDGIPLLMEKFRNNLSRRFPAEAQKKILELSSDQKSLEDTSVSDYMSLYSVEP